jgi:dihydroorotate dehydrogenase
MSWFYRNLIRPMLFTQDSEEIHNRAVAALEWVSQHEFCCDVLSSFFAASNLPVELFGLSFPNPVGLAAGMDKHAAAVPAWSALGFGFAELGGVTWHPQPGNEPPRIFRAVADQALINRMGFNNPGAAAIARKLAVWRAAGRWPGHPVGINLGKSKVTPLDSAAEDYANSLRVLWPYADFFVVNVSSPHTPNLRQLQDKAALDEILIALQEVNDRAIESIAPTATATSTSRRAKKPILVKVAPDISFEALDEILQLVAPRDIAGIVATNTTITRPETANQELRRVYSEPGGLSGNRCGLAPRSFAILSQTRGSCRSSASAEFSAPTPGKIAAGASLVRFIPAWFMKGRELPAKLSMGCGGGWLIRLKEIKQAVGSLPAVDLIQTPRRWARCLRARRLMGSLTVFTRGDLNVAQPLRLRVGWRLAPGLVERTLGELQAGRSGTPGLRAAHGSFLRSSHALGPSPFTKRTCAHMATCCDVSSAEPNFFAGKMATRRAHGKHLVLAGRSAAIAPDFAATADSSSAVGTGFSFSAQF